MIKTKRFYAQRVIEQLQNDYPNLDLKIDERDVFPVMDDAVNKLAAQNYFDNWKFTGEGIDEAFITTFPEVEVTDQGDEQPSYFTFPSNYAALPKNRGIDEIYPLQFQQRGQDFSVVIMSHTDYRRFKNLYAGSLEGRLGGYPEGMKFIFTSCGVKKKYGNMGVRLVVRTAADIAIDASYPIPANWEGEVIKQVMTFFVMKRGEPTDEVRDAKDEA